MIESLTQAQIDRFPEFREKWTKIGLCTEPANRKEAEEAINKWYALAGLSPPERIVWCGSPLAIIDAILEGKFVKDVYGADYDSVSSSVKSSVYDSVKSSVYDSVKSSVYDSVWTPIRNSIQSNINFCYGQHDADWLSMTIIFGKWSG